MKMTPRMRLFTGALTTTLIAAVGAALLDAGQTQLGVVALALAALRGLLLLRQLQVYLSTED